MQALHLHYRGRKAEFKLPPGWKLLTFAYFEDPQEDASMPPDPEQRVKAALQAPVGCESLGKRLARNDSVAILIEDQTRASPKKAILRTLLATLGDLGLADDRIAIVVALGTHRFLTPTEIDMVYGADIARRFRIVNHDCHAPDLVPVGRLSSGKEVKINRLVHEADFRIGIGSIFAHPLNGFGGGGKILFPGVADFDAILEHHLRHSFRGAPRLGVCEGNPFYEEVCSLSKSGRLDFIINSILDHQDRFQDAVCGDPEQAHLEGARRCRQLISRSFQGQADVTIISAFPYCEGPQIMKPLAPAALVTKPGGCILLAADLTASLPESFVQACENFHAKHPNNLKNAVFEHFDHHRRIIDGPPELNMAMAQLLLTLDAYEVILISKDISAETARGIGTQVAADLEQAFAMASCRHPNPEVHVIPAGGMIIPQTT